MLSEWVTLLFEFSQTRADRADTAVFGNTVHREWLASRALATTSESFRFHVPTELEGVAEIANKTVIWVCQKALCPLVWARTTVHSTPTSSGRICRYTRRLYVHSIHSSSLSDSSSPLESPVSCSHSHLPRLKLNCAAATYPLDLVRARLSIATANMARSSASHGFTAEDAALGIVGMTKKVYRTEGGIKGL